MKNVMVSILLFLVCWLVLSFVFKGLYHVELLIKPYTEFGKIILYWGQQFVAFISALWLGFTYHWNHKN